MRQKAKQNYKTLALLNGVAGLLFAIVAYAHHDSNADRMSAVYLPLAFCQLCLCFANLKKWKQEKGEDS